MAGKTFENNRFLGKQSPTHSGKKRPFLPLRKRPKPTHPLSHRHSTVLYTRQEGSRLFISKPRPKERPIYEGPCKHPDRHSAVIARRIIRRKRPFFAGLCIGWRTRLWEAKDVFRSSDLHKSFRVSRLLLACSRKNKRGC